MKKLYFITVTLLAFFLLISTSFAQATSESEWEGYTPEELKILEEQRKELRDMWDKYPVVQNHQPRLKTLQGSMGKCGDILIALDSLTDHVGLVQNGAHVIEAHPDNPNHGVAITLNCWPYRYKKIKGLEVEGAKDYQKADVVAYAEEQVGEPYDLFSGRWSENAWYCSKLVWRAWYREGYDLEGRIDEERGTYVTPGDILASPFTVTFYSSY